jgi:hypothetical protein
MVARCLWNQSVWAALSRSRSLFSIAVYCLRGGTYSPVVLPAVLLPPPGVVLALVLAEPGPQGMMDMTSGRGGTLGGTGLEVWAGCRTACRA